jgi:hypothetical protein
MMILLVLLLLVFPFQGCYSQDAQSAAEQKNSSDPYTWDFGKVKEGDVLKHDFELKNESENTLTVKDIHTSCGCTVSKVQKNILSPGESTIIEVEFKSKGYSGKVQQFVYVNTDSLDKPIIKFIIKAEIAK